MKNSFTIKHYETDFLCIGGGIAGLMAAIRAADLGLQCTIVEKANVKRSGSGGLGNDHFICYLPEVHGDYETFIDDVLRLQNGDRLRQMGHEWAKKFFYATNDIVKLWESWGIPMKHNGEYYFAGHSLPGRTRAFLKYSGRDQKLILTKEAQKRGVQIHNRRTAYEILFDSKGNIAGAAAVDTRENILHVYRAKSILISTGLVNNLWPFGRQSAVGATPDMLNLTGDGRMIAYRAGAELCNLELPSLHSGIKYFSRNGQATWEGVLRDVTGRPLGPFLEKPEPLYGDITMEVRKELIEETNHSERGPVFMDMYGLTQEQMDTMHHWLKQEGNYTLLRHFEQEGVNLMDTAVEFATYPLLMPPSSGIAFNADSETNIKGLYAAGDEGYGGIAGACVTGWWAAESASKFSQNKTLCGENEFDARVQEISDTLSAMLNRNNGAHWKEALQALQNITWDYCGPIRSQAGLEHGLSHLRRIREKLSEQLKAENPHELTLCISILNLYDLAELVFLMALERKESRGYHKRADFVLSDLRLNGKKHYICKNKNNETTMTWR